MRVALPMLTLVPGGMGGSETYARELTRVLKTADGVEATALVPANAAGFSRGIREVVVERVRTGGSTRERLQALAAAATRGSAILASAGPAQVVHYPFTVPVPGRRRGQAMVQTLLDVQHLDLPQLFTRAELAFRARFYEGAAARADAVITISEFAKTRMVDLLGLDPARVHVAHLGVDAADFTPSTGPRDPFVFYPAKAWPHKNHAALVAAMQIVRVGRPELSLVLTGGDMSSLGSLPDWVDVRGLVSGDDLRDLYRRASVLAFPSRYEGFGLPLLEAMASGCPVAASDAGSIPEVVGDAAVLFDPESPDSIAAGILEAMDRSAELTARGLEHVHRFTWERCRDVHAAVYREVAA